MEVKADSRSLLALQPKPNPYKTAVGRGLYLLTMPNGSKLWRLKYYFERRERTLSIGAFPSITLAQAIKTRDEARAAIEAVLTRAQCAKQKRTNALSNGHTLKPFAWS
jgi:hypothetical protein